MCPQFSYLIYNFDFVKNWKNHKSVVKLQIQDCGKLQRRVHNNLINQLQISLLQGQSLMYSRKSHTRTQSTNAFIKVL